MARKILLEGSRVFLRLLEEEDASVEYASWLNNPKVTEFLESKRKEPFSYEEIRNYISDRSKDPNCLFFGIFDRGNGTHIGNVKLEPVDYDKGETCLGMIIGDTDYWGKGICTEVMKLIIVFTFNELELDYLYLGVLPQNTGAIRCYEKAGLKQEKIIKNAKNYDGIWYDQIIMGIRKDRK